MNSESVDLIATDPPFNKGRDFHATTESIAKGAKFQDSWSWKDDVHEAWTDQIQDDHPAVWAVIDWSRMTYGDDMGAFLCFMAVRLLEMRRILKETLINLSGTKNVSIIGIGILMYSWRKATSINGRARRLRG